MGRFTMKVILPHPSPPPGLTSAQLLCLPPIASSGFKSDMGAFMRLYTFLSQIFDYDSTAIEKRAIFY